MAKYPSAVLVYIPRLSRSGRDLHLTHSSPRINPNALRSDGADATYGALQA